MPERYSDEHLRFLQMGIPVYPGDEALIAQIAGQARTDAGRYKPWRGAIGGDPMGGNVTPRFGMDTARQRSTNLGLPKAKRKVVEKIVDDPNTPDSVTITTEDEVPSQDMRTMGKGEQFIRDPIGYMFGYNEPRIQEQPKVDTSTGRGPRWADRTDPHPFWGEGNLPRIITAPVKAISDVVSGTADVVGSGLESVGTGTAETVAGLARTQEEHDAYLAAQAKEQAILEGKDDVTTPPPPPRQPAVAGPLQPNFQQGDPVARIYGNWSRDIPTERKEYLRAMKDIYFKMSMLSAVASLTGGEDQSEGFGRMQVEMLNYMMETDNQERLLKIHKGVYFNKDGKWDPPKNERMAHQRAVRFGAGPEEASEFSGFYPKTEGIWQNWIVKDEQGNELLMASQGGPPEGYVEYRLATAGFGLGKERFRTFKLEFNQATTENGRMSVARRYARDLKDVASGGFMYQPPTEGEVQAAYNELKGDFEPTDIKKVE